MGTGAAVPVLTPDLTSAFSWRLRSNFPVIVLPLDSERAAGCVTPKRLTRGSSADFNPTA